MTYDRGEGAPAAVVEVREPHDWAEVCNKAAMRMGYAIATGQDEQFEKIKAARITRERVGDSAGDVWGPEARLRLGAPSPSPAVAGVRDTSMGAYRALEWSGRLSKQQRLLADFFLANQQRDFTRQELSQATGLPINVICGRVNELMHEPMGLLTEGERRTCRITRERALPLSLARVHQMAETA